MHYVQHNFFAGESFVDLADCRARAETWCTTTAGMRIHGTTQCRPVEAFRTEEQPCSAALPRHPFDTPAWSDPKVHRDFHVEVDRAIYSVPYDLVGRTLRARRDSTTREVLPAGRAGQAPSPQSPGGSARTDPADMPPGKEIYATRDVERLKRMAAAHGDAIGTYAAAILDTRCRGPRCARSTGCSAWSRSGGPSGVEQACRRALDAEAVDVNLVVADARAGPGGRRPRRAGPSPVVVQGRFARDPSEFASVTEAGPMSAPTPTVSPELKVLMRTPASSASCSTPCPSAWRWPAATTSATSSSSSSSSATR